MNTFRPEFGHAYNRWSRPLTYSQTLDIDMAGPPVIELTPIRVSSVFRK